MHCATQIIHIQYARNKVYHTTFEYTPPHLIIYHTMLTTFILLLYMIHVAWNINMAQYHNYKTGSFYRMIIIIKQG